MIILDVLILILSLMKNMMMVKLMNIWRRRRRSIFVFFLCFSTI